MPLLTHHLSHITDIPHLSQCWHLSECRQVNLALAPTILGLQEHESASLQDEAAAWEETRVESKHAAGLVQLEHGMGRFGRSIPSDPQQWACDETGVKENLWLNLSTGFIGSGRQVSFPTPSVHPLCILQYESLRRELKLQVSCDDALSLSSSDVGDEIF